MRNVGAVGHRRKGSTRMSVSVCLCLCARVLGLSVLEFSSFSPVSMHSCMRVPEHSSVFSPCTWAEELCIAGGSLWAGYSYPQTYLIAMYSHREMINSLLLEHSRFAPESDTRELRKGKNPVHIRTCTQGHKHHFNTFISLYIYVRFL